uniref:Peptidase M13 C-terminal domain-containing protein n=1 Tax=Ditylenchus dipsaci TaxID=166011 RepID=A0A915EM38_9BILA
MWSEDITTLSKTERILRKVYSMCRISTAKCLPLKPTSSILEALDIYNRTQMELREISEPVSNNYSETYNTYSLLDMEKAFPNIDWTQVADGLGVDVGAANRNSYFMKYMLEEQAEELQYNVLRADPTYKWTLLNDYYNHPVFAHIFQRHRRNSIALGKSMRTKNMKSHKEKLFLIRHPEYFRKLNDLLEDGPGQLWSITMSSKHSRNTTLHQPPGDRLLVDENVASQDRKKVVKEVYQMAEAVQSELISRIDKIDWLSPSTSTSYEEIDKYHQDYFPILKTNDYLEAFRLLIDAHTKNERKEMLQERLSQQLFDQSPTIVNAFHMLSLNSIALPYAQLMKPFYETDFPTAFKYGNTATILGHEMAHGFDNSGIQFGMIGDFRKGRSLLDDYSKLLFNQTMNCLANQYSKNCCMKVNGVNKCVDGRKTQGENMADIFGLQLAYSAFQKVKAKSNQNVNLPGLLRNYTQEQLFWISFAQGWCLNVNKPADLTVLFSDTHSFGKCRVNEALKNVQEFGE